ncbi:MAG: hypothetical protein MUC34_14730, partial [Anaerolineae bacterium]|nr:hypothetical protein [Anaerolineae bacterium]
YESLVLNAEERVLELEGQLYRQVLGQVAAAAPQLLATAAAVAELDVFAALAEVAEANRYARPQLNESGLIDIRAGLHPVVEKLLPDGARFTPNDAHLSPEQAIVVLTGPNMGARGLGCHRPGRPHLYPHRRVGRDRPRPVDLHGRDGRNGEYPPPRDRALPADP